MRSKPCRAADAWPSLSTLLEVGGTPRSTVYASPLPTRALAFPEAFCLEFLNPFLRLSPRREPDWASGSCAVFSPAMRARFGCAVRRRLADAVPLCPSSGLTRFVSRMRKCQSLLWPLKGHHRLHVLVIDDEQYVADTLVMILEQSGLQATAAYDAESALRKAESFPPT